MKDAFNKFSYERKNKANPAKAPINKTLILRLEVNYTALNFAIRHNAFKYFKDLTLSKLFPISLGRPQKN